MSNSNSKSLKRECSNDLQPRSLVFVNAGENNGKRKNIELVAIHIEELKAEVKPRVMDKLVLENPQQYGNTCIKQFLKLQAEPICLIVESNKIDKLQFLAACLQWFEALPQDLWYATFALISGDQNTEPDEKRLKVDFQASEDDDREEKNTNDFSIIDWVKTHQSSFLESLQPKPFSGLAESLQPKLSGLPKRTGRFKRCLSTGASLIFLDLEATGLDTRKITEICMAKVTKSELLSGNEGAVPTECDKMVLTVDPLIEINEEASKLSAMKRSMLTRSQKKAFDVNVANCVIQFILRYSGPVCLVAHAGNRFDFEVLVDHLQSATNAKRQLRNVKSYDTLVGFKHMRGRRKGLSLAALYSSCSDGEEIPNSHTAEGDVMALMKVVACNPGVLDTVKEAGLFSGVVNREKRERLREQREPLTIYDVYDEDCYYERLYIM